MLKNLPKIYRKDKWVNVLYNASQLELEIVKQLDKSNRDNTNFDTLDERGCSIYEKDLQILPRVTLEDRRKVIKEKWLSNYKVSLPSLQRTADSYFNKLLDVSYNGDAYLVFTTQIGLNYFETDMSEFNKVIELIKPAHFGIKWEHVHNKWEDYYNPIVWRNGLNWTWNSKSNTQWQNVRGLVNKKTWEYVISRSWAGHLTERIEYGE